ncbi:MAG: hypothetical protein M3O22_04905, partial [Pseudomonadota bacterium]|nr:hypothetical protein [Pseudomonadota bacterium]
MYDIFTRRAGPAGDFFEIPVQKKWAGGVMVTAHAIPLREATAPASGSAWLAMDPALTTLSVTLETPQMVPGQGLQVPVILGNLSPGEKAAVLVDGLFREEGSQTAALSVVAEAGADGRVTVTLPEGGVQGRIDLAVLAWSVKKTGRASAVLSVDRKGKLERVRGIEPPS